jgi:hypothetical protein
VLCAHNVYTHNSTHQEQEEKQVNNNGSSSSSTAIIFTLNAAKAFCLIIRNIMLLLLSFEM